MLHVRKSGQDCAEDMKPEQWLPSFWCENGAVIPTDAEISPKSSQALIPTHDTATELSIYYKSFRETLRNT